MDIGRIIAIGLTATVLAVSLKKESPHFSILVSAAAGILIFLQILPPLGGMMELLRLTAEKAGVSDSYFGIILKVIGIAYLSQFGAQLCADAGEGTVAAKVELAGKIMIMAVSAPVLTALLQTVLNLV